MTLLLQFTTQVNRERQPAPTLHWLGKSQQHVLKVCRAQPVPGDTGCPLGCAVLIREPAVLPDGVGACRTFYAPSSLEALCRPAFHLRKVNHSFSTDFVCIYHPDLARRQTFANGKPPPPAIPLLKPARHCSVGMKNTFGDLPR